MRAPRGTQLSCKGWQQEAALRMLMNNLDPEVAEKPRRPDRLRRARQGRAQLGLLSRHRGFAEITRSSTKLFWCSPASPWEFFARIHMRRAC